MANADRAPKASMDEAVIRVEVNAVRLQQAVLCADCDVITDSPHDTCSICGSRSLLPLARVLGNTQPTPTPAVQEVVVQSPAVVPDTVFVLTSPVSHRPRRRQSATRG
jgi:hypothetical protein